ncbi:MAG: ABC transporter ATP-binding protein [Clostridia bacterium]|nr:ABC transporter ATP-binding protein [Clostridia bacterium]
MSGYIEMRGITKVYPSGVVANKNVNLSIEKGEIHAIAGENGAGKSTIMKVLYGAEKADGEIFLDGRKVSINSPRAAGALGIGMVYQHFMLVGQFTAWENIFFGIEEKNALGVLKKKEMIRRAEELCEKYDMHVDLTARAADVSASTAQKIEILTVLARGAQLLILDEPTAVLTPQETEQLFGQLRLLKKSGYTIIIITHKLKEIMALCDRVTIMRQGENVGVYNISDVSEAEISRLMVGRDVQMKVDKEKAQPGEALLTVTDLTVRGKGGRNAVSGVSFSAHRGEILCIAGVEGNGQREVVRSVCGLNRKYTGEIRFGGVNVAGMKIRKIRKLGLSHIPEDRMTTGCNTAASICDNLIALDYAENSRLGFLKTKKLRERSCGQIADYGIKGTLNQKIGMLSGGNMQKVVVARELDSDPALIVADQPTRGVDIGAIETIHKRIVAMRDAGKAVILVSADLAEVFSLADRIIVFHDGEITADITDVSSVDEVQLGRYMLGLERMEVQHG